MRIEPRNRRAKIKDNQVLYDHDCFWRIDWNQDYRARQLMYIQELELVYRRLEAVTEQMKRFTAVLTSVRKGLERKRFVSVNKSGNVVDDS